MQALASSLPRLLITERFISHAIRRGALAPKHERSIREHADTAGVQVLCKRRVVTRLVQPQMDQ